MPAFQKFISALNAAIRRYQVEVEVQRSNNVITSLRLLRDYGFINGFIIKDTSVKVLLKYIDRRPVLKQLVSISTPGRRVYGGVRSLNLVLSKLQKNTDKPFYNNFLLLVSTKYGILTHYDLKQYYIGGLFLCIAYA